MMLPIKQLADKIGISPENLRHKLQKPDAPECKLRLRKNKIIKYYDEDEISRWMEEI